MKRFFLTGCLLAMCGFVAVSPAMASGGSAGGGGAAKPGGGGKASGGSATDGGSVVVPLSSYGLTYNGAVPQGTVTLGYATDGSAQSMGINLNSIKVSSGTVLPVRVIIGHLETIFTYYQISQIVYTEVDGSITVKGNSATLQLSTLNGDVVPNFPGPTAAGTTEIKIMSPDGSLILLDGITGSFHA